MWLIGSRPDTCAENYISAQETAQSLGIQEKAGRCRSKQRLHRDGKRPGTVILVPSNSRNLVISYRSASKRDDPPITSTSGTTMIRRLPVAAKCCSLRRARRASQKGVATVRRRAMEMATSAITPIRNHAVAIITRSECIWARSRGAVSI